MEKVMWVNPTSDEGLEATNFGEPGGMLPEPYRSFAERVALVHVYHPTNGVNATLFTFIEFSDNEHAQEYYEHFYEGVTDLVSFPGGWAIIGSTVVVQINA